MSTSSIMYKKLEIWVFIWAVAMQLSHAIVDISVKSFQTCPDHLGLPDQFTDIGLAVDPDTHNLLVNSTLILKEAVEDGMTVHIILRKCFTDNPNSCEIYMETDTDNFCNHINEQDKIWSSIISKTENFGPECPVQPGTYLLVEGPVDLTALGDFDAMIGFWQLELEFMVKKEMKMCIMGDGEIFKRKRGRKNKPLEDDAPLPLG